MKRKKIDRVDINSLKIKRKKKDWKAIFELIKKIGTPFDPPAVGYGQPASA